MPENTTSPNVSRPVMRKVHPLVNLLVLLLLVITLQHLQGFRFALLAVGLLLLAMWRYRVLLLQMLRRTRWLMLSMLLLYALPDVLAVLGNTGSQAGQLQQSAIAGGIQVLHLAAVLASLCLMTGGLSRSELLEGLLKMLQPLSLLGVEVKLLAVRVMLTLQYLEKQNLAGDIDRKKVLEALFSLPAFASVSMHYSDTALEWQDKLLSILIILIILNILLA